MHFLYIDIDIHVYMRLLMLMFAWFISKWTCRQLKLNNNTKKTVAETREEKNNQTCFYLLFLKMCLLFKFCPTLRQRVKMVPMNCRARVSSHSQSPKETRNKWQSPTANIGENIFPFKFLFDFIAFKHYEIRQTYQTHFSSLYVVTCSERSETGRYQKKLKCVKFWKLSTTKN